MDSTRSRWLAAVVSTLAAPALLAAPPAVPSSSPSAAPVACCRSTDEFPWRNLPAFGQSVEVGIDAQSPHYRFHTGESAFAAFRLPMATAPYRIQIRALSIPEASAPGGWRVFYPQAVLLDADHLVSRTASAENARLEPVGGELAPDGAYLLELPIDPVTDAERYLVIHTVAPQPAPTPSKAWLQSRGAVMRAASGWQAGAADTGRLRITVLAGR